MKFLKPLGVVALLLFVAGCAKDIKSDVARFHQLQNVNQGATFTIVPKTAEKVGSLEFEQYASLVRAQMVEQGFTPVNVANASDLVVAIDYRVSDGDTVIRTRNTALYGFGGFGWQRFYHPFYGGGFGGAGGFGGPDVYSYQVYTRDLDLEIIRPTAAETPKDVVFEGKVQSVGRDRRLPEVMPYLVQAMFTDFPGQNGVTKEVRIELPKS